MQHPKLISLSVVNLSCGTHLIRGKLIAPRARNVHEHVCNTVHSTVSFPTLSRLVSRRREGMQDPSARVSSPLQTTTPCSSAQARDHAMILSFWSTLTIQDARFASNASVRALRSPSSASRGAFRRLAVLPRSPWDPSLDDGDFDPPFGPPDHGCKAFRFEVSFQPGFLPVQISI